MAPYVVSQQRPYEPSETHFDNEEGDGGCETLTRLSVENLLEKPELLQEEVERTKREVQDLVARNCDLLLASSRTLGSVRRSEKEDFSLLSGYAPVKGISLCCLAVTRLFAFLIKNTLTLTTSLAASTDALKSSLEAFVNSQGDRLKKAEVVQKVTAAQNDVAKALAFPSTIRTYYEAGLYADAVDHIVFATEQVSLLLLHAPPGNELLQHLQQQVEQERMRCQATLLRALAAPSIHFAEIVKCVGHLRRLGVLSEEDVRQKIIKQRSCPIDRRKSAIEIKCNSSPTRALCEAANLLATDVHEIIVQYRALFKAIDEASAFWLADQINWFLSLLFSVLDAGTLVVQETASSSSGGIDEREATTQAAVAIEQTQVTGEATGRQAGTAKAEEQEAVVAGGQRVSSLTLEQQNLCAVYRQTHHAAANLSRVGGYFFGAAAPAFEIYSRKVVEGLASAAAQKFVQEVQEASISWTPGSLFCGPSEGVEETAASTTFAASSVSDQADSAAFQKRMVLLWYPSLCGFYNGLVRAINAVLDFPLLNLLSSLFSSVIRALWIGAHTLRNILKKKESYEGWTAVRKNEFIRLYDAFSNELLDLICLHLHPLQAEGDDIQETITNLRRSLQEQRLDIVSTTRTHSRYESVFEHATSPSSQAN